MFLSKLVKTGKDNLKGFPKLNTGKFNLKSSLKRKIVQQVFYKYSKYPNININFAELRSNANPLLLLTLKENKLQPNLQLWHIRALYTKPSRLFFGFQSTFFPGIPPSSSSYHLMELRVGRHNLWLPTHIFSREPHIVPPYSHFQQGATDCCSLPTFSVGSHILWLPTYIFSREQQIVAPYF